MSVTTTTHLNFRGEARAALEFYQRVFGGDLTVISYRDAGAAPDGATPTR
jgi:PhnB protein